MVPIMRIHIVFVHLLESGFDIGLLKKPSNIDT